MLVFYRLFRFLSVRENKHSSILLVCLCLFIYSNTLLNEYVFDSKFFVENNTEVKKGVLGVFDFFTQSYINPGDTFANKANGYRPLTIFSFAAEHSFFGANPIVSHAVQLFIYCLSIFVLYVLLKGLFKDSSRLALFVCLLFASHPVHSEVINDVKNRDELLVFLFGLLSVWSMLKFHAQKKNLYYSFSLVFFLLAMLSKENGILFIGLILLFAYYFSPVSWREVLKFSIPFFLVGFFILWLSFYLSGGIQASSIDDVSMNSLSGINTINEKVSTIIYILGKHLQLLAFPHPLLSSYRFNTIPISKLTDFSVIFSVLIHLIALFFAIKGIKKKSLLSFGILFYYISVFPYSNILMVAPDDLAERYLFTPSLGFLIVFSVVLSNVKKIRKNALLIISGIVILFTFMGIIRNQDWQSNFTLFSKDVSVSPNCAQTNLLLSQEYKNFADKEVSKDKKDALMASAFYYVERSLIILPSYYRAHKTHGDYYFSVGMYDKSIKSMEIAAFHVPKSQPEYLAHIYNSKSLALQQKGEFSRAIIELNKALSLSSSKKNKSFFYNNLGTNYFYTKQYQNAINNFLTSASLNPEFYEPVKNLAIAYKEAGDLNSANYYYNLFQSTQTE